MTSPDHTKALLDLATVQVRRLSSVHSRLAAVRSTVKGETAEALDKILHTLDGDVRAATSERAAAWKAHRVEHASPTVLATAETSAELEKSLSDDGISPRVAQLTLIAGGKP